MSKLRNRYQESRITIKRLALVSMVFILLYGVLVGRLYQLQVSHYQQYQVKAEKNKNREIYIAPYRGDIIDRNGEALATYATRYVLTISNRHEKNEKVLESLGIHLKDKDKYNIDHAQFAYLSNHPLDGVSIEAIPYRYYPLGAAAAHVVGYTGHMKSEYVFRDTPLEGKSGIEKIYQSELFGIAGLQRQHKNAKGELFNTNVLREAERSPPLTLTIDGKLQSYVHNLMLSYAGTVIVLDPNNGELLAACSSPSFDPNELFKHDYAKRLEMARKPMFNRLSQALYSPGSIIKPFIAMGALDDNLLDPDEIIEDPGYFKINENSRTFHDHKRTGHGKVDLFRAITFSCDTYFYHLSLKLGIDRIVQYLKAYHLGDKTDVEMVGEVSGVLPTKAYRQKHYRKWYQGQTVISGIGQGDILCSPLQLARAVMLFANKGYDYPLTCIKDSVRPKPANIEMNEEHRDILVKAMEEVVLTGTARKIGKKPYSIAAKTATVQVVELIDKSSYHKLPEHQKDHHMTVAFSPSDNPSIVLVVIIEHQNEANLVAEKILDWCYNAGYIT